MARTYSDQPRPLRVETNALDRKSMVQREVDGIDHAMARNPQLANVM